MVPLGVALAIGSAACGPPTSDDEVGVGLGDRGGRLIMAWDASHEPASLDGHVEPYQPAWLIDSLIADPLVVLGPDGEYYPALAKSWTSSENADQWTFTLRDDVVFQDGTPFDAAAVKYNIERIVDPETRSGEMAARVGPIDRVEVVDDYTVRLHYRAPWVTALDAFRLAPIWSPTAMEQWGLREFDKHLVGAGPFTLQEWVPNDHVALERWDGYGGWNGLSEAAGPVPLGGVRINFIGEEAVLGSVVRTGDADIAMNLPAAYAEDYEDREGFRLIKGYQAGTGLSMVMNTRRAPFDQLAFRQALVYGTDQDAVNDLLYDGSYLPSYGPLNTVHPCHWDGALDYYPHDPEKATSLLEQVGYTDEDGDGIREAHGVRGVADGTPLTVQWTVLHHEEIGEAVQAQWRRLGIDLVVEIVPGPIQIERVNNRDFDLMYERQRSPDPMVLDMVWNSAHDVFGGWAWTGLVNAELDETVGRLRVVPDPEARCEVAYTAQKILLDNVAMLPTLSEPMFYAVAERVQGFQLLSEGHFFTLHNTSLR